MSHRKGSSARVRGLIVILAELMVFSVANQIPVFERKFTMKGMKSMKVFCFSFMLFMV
jgi:hypothetical protein